MASTMKTKVAELEDAFDAFPLRVSPRRAAGHVVKSEPTSRRRKGRQEQAEAAAEAFKGHKDDRIAEHTERQAAAAEETRARQKKKAERAEPKAPVTVELERDKPLTCSSYWFGEPPTVEVEVRKAVAEADRVVPSAGDRCCVCLGDFDPQDADEDEIIQLGKCLSAHPVHAGCIASALAVTPRCPICLVSYSSVLGTQPPGTMSLTRTRGSLAGTSGDMVIVSYSFPSGTQGPRHPNPGTYYHGTSRNAYVPYTDEGRAVLAKLMRAWDRRVIFTVGTSITTGAENTVVWNGIHHKTNPHGGAENFGYPDKTYLNRVTLEMAAFGID